MTWLVSMWQQAWRPDQREAGGMQVQQNIQSSTSLQDEKQKEGEFRSETYVVQTMPAVLGKRDMIITAIMALFLLTNAVSGAAGGPVALFYLILGAIVFFAPCV